MNYLQKEFIQFHEAIKLYENAENSILREKRDMLTKELRTYFDQKSKAEGTAKITFDVRNQGSYSMATGIKPIDGDYDIDVMVLFNIDIKDYPNPTIVKKWVKGALERPGRTIVYKNPCVTVQYLKNGLPAFHVDLALYGNRNDIWGNQTYISKGKPGANTNDRAWEISNPEELKTKINNRFSNAEESAQMRRVIRYLKRWKDLKFKNSGNGKPTGIAITALVYNLFQPSVFGFFSSTSDPDDIRALKALVQRILDQFRWMNNCDWNEHTISVKLPVVPGNDLFVKMTCKQHQAFKEKLIELKNALSDAERSNINPATKILRKQFGNDFPLIT